MLKEKYLPYQITQHNKHRRINRLNIKIKEMQMIKAWNLKMNIYHIAIDSTGKSQIEASVDDGRDKWNIKKKGYLKIHI
jgi:hypothetical protein